MVAIFAATHQTKPCVRFPTAEQILVYQNDVEWIHSFLNRQMFPAANTLYLFNKLCASKSDELIHQFARCKDTKIYIHDEKGEGEHEHAKNKLTTSSSSSVIDVCPYFNYSFFCFSSLAIIYPTDCLIIKSNDNKSSSL